MIISDIGLGISTFILDDKKHDDTLIHQIAIIGIIVLIFIISAACWNTLSIIAVIHIPEIMPAKGLVLSVF